MISKMLQRVHNTFVRFPPSLFLGLTLTALGITAIAGQSVTYQRLEQATGISTVLVGIVNIVCGLIIFHWPHNRWWVFLCLPIFYYVYGSISLTNLFLGQSYISSTTVILISYFLLILQIAARNSTYK